MDGRVRSRQIESMRGTSTTLLALATLAAAAPCLAAPQAVIPDALQQDAMTCVGEAVVLGR